jgi:hypothetical protein
MHIACKPAVLRPVCSRVTSGVRVVATVSFSVPEDVKERFDAAFEGQDTNAVFITLLMGAIEDEERRRRSLSLVERLRLVNRRSRPVDGGIGSAR